MQLQLSFSRLIIPDGGYDTDRKVLGARLLEAGIVVDGVFDKSVSKGADSFYLASEPRV